MHVARLRSMRVCHHCDMALDDDGDEGADLGDASERSSRWRDVISTFSAPPMPLQQPWSISIAALVGRVYKVPSVAAKALGQLDRIGCLRLTPDVIAFDNEEIEWGKLTVVRTRSVADVLTETAVHREMERFRKALPPIPGRKWVVNRAADGVSQLTQIALERAGGQRSTQRIAAELEYRGGLGRRRSTQGGIVVAAVLAGIPGLNDVLEATARQNGAAVEDSA